MIPMYWKQLTFRLKVTFSVLSAKLSNSDTEDAKTKIELNALMSKVTPENIHPRIDFVRRTGKELL